MGFVYVTLFAVCWTIAVLWFLGKFYWKEWVSGLMIDTLNFSVIVAWAPVVIGYVFLALKVLGIDVY